MSNVIDLKSRRQLELVRFWQESVLFWSDFLAKTRPTAEAREVAEVGLADAKSAYAKVLAELARDWPDELRSEEERLVTKAADLLGRRVRVVVTTRSDFKDQLGLASAIDFKKPGLVRVVFPQGLGVESFDVSQLEVVS